MFISPDLPLSFTICSGYHLVFQEKKEKKNPHQQIPIPINNHTWTGPGQLANLHNPSPALNCIFRRGLARSIKGPWGAPGPPPLLSQLPLCHVHVAGMVHGQ